MEVGVRPVAMKAVLTTYKKRSTAGSILGDSLHKRGCGWRCLIFFFKKMDEMSDSSMSSYDGSSGERVNKKKRVVIDVDDVKGKQFLVVHADLPLSPQMFDGMEVETLEFMQVCFLVSICLMYW